MRSRGTIVASLAATLLGCGGGGPAQPPTTLPDDSRASFALAGAGYDVTNTYSNAGGNLIFCRREEPLPNTIWIRLAAERNADGEQGPHIDIDLCNFAGSGSYQAVHDVSGARTCSQGQTFAIWWHDGPSKVFVSRPASQACTVAVTQGTGVLDGTFQCRGLTPFKGTGPGPDVSAGSFRCHL